MPYIAVLVTAVMGVNVFVVLVGGIFLAGAIGLWYGALAPLSFAQAIYKGFLSMSDIFLLSLFTGGLAEMVSRAGGIAFLLDRVQRFIHGKNSAELGIPALVSITDIALANNTVAIIINGEVAKGICYTFHVDPAPQRRPAQYLFLHLPGPHPLRRPDAYRDQLRRRQSFAAGSHSLRLVHLPLSHFSYRFGFIPFLTALSRKTRGTLKRGSRRASRLCNFIGRSCRLPS